MNDVYIDEKKSKKNIQCIPFKSWASKCIQLGQGQSGETIPLEKLIEEIPGFGKTGQFLPTLMPQVQGLRDVFSFAEIIENSLDSLDSQAGLPEPLLFAGILTINPG